MLKEMLRRIRWALGMGLTWAVAGALIGVGLDLVRVSWPGLLGSMVKQWAVVLAPTGLIGGITFAAVLAVAARKKAFHDLSLLHIAAWGAVAGSLLSLVPVAFVMLGWLTDTPIWDVTARTLVPLAIGGSLASTGSLLLARAVEDREVLSAHPEGMEVPAGHDEAPRLSRDARRKADA